MSGLGLLPNATTESAETVSWFRAFCLVGTIVLVGVLLIFLQGILVPFTFAVFLAYLVRPFSEFIGSCCRRQPVGDTEEHVDVGANAMKRFTTMANATVQRTLPRWVGAVLALVALSPPAPPVPYSMRSHWPGPASLRTATPE